jgi:hypothetical protein
MLFLQFIVLPHNYLLRNCYLQHKTPYILAHTYIEDHSLAHQKWYEPVRSPWDSVPDNTVFVLIGSWPYASKLMPSGLTKMCAKIIVPVLG